MVWAARWWCSSCVSFFHNLSFHDCVVYVAHWVDRSSDHDIRVFTIASVVVRATLSAALYA